MKTIKEQKIPHPLCMVSMGTILEDSLSTQTESTHIFHLCLHTYKISQFFSKQICVSMFTEAL